MLLIDFMFNSNFTKLVLLVLINSKKRELENIFANVTVIFYFVNRLFSPTLSHQSLTQSLEFESAAMLSSSFLDARFEMEHAVKTESRRVSVC